MLQLDVAPGITFVEGERRGRFPFGNVLVLRGRQARVVVDTGPGPEILAAAAAGTGGGANLGTGAGTGSGGGAVTGAGVDVVVNTHYHIDHVRGNGQLAAAFPEARFWCPAGEAGPLSSWDKFLEFTGFGLPAGREDARESRVRLGWTPTPVSRELADGEVLDFGGLRATVLRLPGHTPGHTGLLFPSEGVVFSADIDLSSFGPWYGDVYASVDDYVRSLERLRTLVDEISGRGRRSVTVLTSHRRPLSYETFSQRFPAFAARLGEREERILAMLAAAAGPLTLDGIVAGWPIYGPQTGQVPGIYKSEYFMVKHHLDRLARAGRITPVEPAAPGGATLWRAS